MMDAVQISDYAGRLLRAHGAQAEAEAARKARECEERGRMDEAQDWRAIREALHGRRPPRQG